MLSATKSFKKLQNHYEEMRDKTIADLFASDRNRADKFSLELDGLFIDYSKNNITDETMRLLGELSAERDLANARDAMFSGQKINSTEDRAVLHTALRNVENKPVVVDGNDITKDINYVLERMRKLSLQINSGNQLGQTGRPIKNIVNIGIGGSSLGPEMAYEALRYYTNRDLTFRFISNIDPADFYEKTIDLDPAETLFIIASKTFTTLETMDNANTARDWLLNSLKTDAAVSKHFIAVSANREAVEKFGISAENTFEMWDFVGGRYSLLSSIGLSLMIAIGPDNFDKLRSGASYIDEHFKTADLQGNAPAILALIGIWNRNFQYYPTEAVLPYSQYLHRLPAYLQQANMESNGKSVSIDGQQLNYDTGPVVWGESGTNGQHAFHQLMHQGTTPVPADFIGFKEPLKNYADQHEKLLANMVAQSEALAFGANDSEPHKFMPGNRPSNTFLFDKLTPYSLGQLIALYEHKIFVQGKIWGINSFDQFGVELGKVLANKILDQKETDDFAEHDSSTKTLLEKIF